MLFFGSGPYEPPGVFGIVPSARSTAGRATHEPGQHTSLERNLIIRRGRCTRRPRIRATTRPSPDLLDFSELAKRAAQMMDLREL